MTDEQTTPQPDQTPSTSGNVWHEVGGQFQALGESLATAFRTAWKSEENRKHAQAMQTGLKAMVDEIGKAIQETAALPETQKARSKAEKTAQSLHAAGQQTWQEARPHLVSALRQLNIEVQKAISQLEQEEPANAAAEGTIDKPNA